MRNFRKILCFCLICALITASFSLSYCHAESLPLKLEKEIGFTSYRQIIREKQVVTLTPEKDSQLRQIFSSLIAHSRRNQEISFTLTVVVDPEINAYALPGGYVIVNTGLLEFTDRPGELAAALAHEIGHVDCKHGFNSVARTVGWTIILRLLTTQTDNPDHLTQIGAVAMALAQKGYSRGDEYQADQAAAVLLRDAGYSQGNLVNFFKKLERESAAFSSKFFLWRMIDTHPPLPERIKRIESIR